jgi:hypothetical protein
VHPVIQAALDRGLATIRKNYEAQVRKGKLKQDKYEQRISLLSHTLNYADLKDADLVIEAATETSTTMMAPPARPRKIVVGTRSMPESAITTVRPLKKTARFAVAPERPIERSLSPPFRRSSRYRDTMNNE